MELKINRQDMDRLLACLVYAAHRFDEEATRQHRITTAMVGHPLGLLGGVISEAIAELFAAESEQLRQLHARLAQAVSLDRESRPAWDVRHGPDQQKD
jgi:hypothetical protein